MRINFIFFLFILFSLNSYLSQNDDNLVLNPSFESIDGKLRKLNQINVATDWYSPTSLRADLFSSNVPGNIGTPENIYGKEFPKEGENYAGILTYSYNNKKPRTYLQSMLIKPLASELSYCVNINVSLSDLSKYAIDNIGVYISEEPVTLDKKGDIIFNDKAELSAVVTNEKSKIYKSRYKWETICGVYQSNGKEKYITIGNFFNNKDTEYEKLAKSDDFPGSQLPEAYYYIDNVELILVEDPDLCDCNKGQKKKRESIVYHLDVQVDEKLPIDEKLKKYSIYFDVESYYIDPMFDNNLNNVIDILKKNPDLKLQLNGHIDNLEKQAINGDPENKVLKNLGNYRSKSVKDFLLKNGISLERITGEDLGSDQPASKGTTMFSMAKNRRVEFVIIK